MSTATLTTHNGRVLADTLLALSDADDWSDAAGEWRTDRAYTVPADRPMRRCACGHSPIRNVFVLKNRVTGERAEVGCVCVRKFLPDAAPVDPFAVLERVRQNCQAAIRPDEVDTLVQLGWVWAKDARFLRTNGKRPFARLSGPQQRWRLDVNRRLVMLAEQTPDEED